MKKSLTSINLLIALSLILAAGSVNASVKKVYKQNKEDVRTQSQSRDKEVKNAQVKVEKSRGNAKGHETNKHTYIPGNTGNSSQVSTKGNKAIRIQKNNNVKYYVKKENTDSYKNYQQRKTVVYQEPVYRPLKVKGRRYYHRDGRYFRHTSRGYIEIAPPVGALVLGLPFGHTTLVLGGSTYFYSGGVYYKRHYGEYIVADAPYGHRVRVLPGGACKIRIGGRVYFEFGGIYYSRFGTGFVITEPPVRVVERAPVIEQKEYYTVMIDNSNGSHTPVDVEYLGNDTWKGPKGEIYYGRPSYDQLEEAYGF